MRPRTRIGHLIFELTEACNQRCRFCYNYWRDGRALDPPDPGLCRKTLRKLFSQAEIGNLRELGVAAVQIPVLSSRPEVHDALTGLPGSWAKATDTLGRVVREIPGGACAVLVVTKVNAPHVAETLDFLSTLGVGQVMLNRFNLGGTGLLNAKELVLERASLARAFSEANAFAAAHPALRLVSGVCTPLCLLDPAAYPHIRFTTCTTDLLTRPIAVNFRGEVRFCNHSPKVLGNLYDRPLGEILSDPAVTEPYRAVPEACATCEKWTRCHGGCRAASEQVHGSFAAVDPVLDFS